MKKFLEGGDSQYEYVANGLIRVIISEADREEVREDGC